MNKFIIIFLSIGFAGLMSCQNQDWEFDDFEYTTAYFPYQTPVRTLVLDEDYIFDNSNDLQMKFWISATMGGVYENDRDQMVEYQIDESLVNGLVNDDGEPIIALPESYYSIINGNDNTIIIPSGKMFGSIEIQLTEAFLQDKKAVGVNYVIPVKMISATTDSVLRGKPAISEPDPRLSSDWDLMPKDYTLFGIKYVNRYHGRYLLRGQSTIRDTDGNIVNQIEYRQPNVVEDEVVLVRTDSVNTVVYGNALRSTTGNFEIIIEFDDNGNATITETENSDFPVTGTAEFARNGDEWGGKQRNAIYLAYEINDGTNTHNVIDTLVFRDKNVAFEEFSLNVE